MWAACHFQVHLPSSVISLLPKPKSGQRSSSPPVSSRNNPNPDVRFVHIIGTLNNREYCRTHGAAAPAVCGGPVFQARTAFDRLGAKGSLHSDSGDRAQNWVDW